MTVKRYVFLLLLIAAFLLQAGLFTVTAETADYRDIHTVVPGDTVYDLAMKYWISPNDIIAANPSLNPDLIHPGDKIIIPLDKSNFLGAGHSFAPVPIDGYSVSPDISRISGYKFTDDNNAVGVWKYVGLCDNVEAFDADIGAQLEVMKKNPGMKITFAEYGDIKNPGDFAWSAGMLYNYAAGGSNSAYVIKRVGSFKYMFLEYNPKNRIFSDISTVDKRFVVFRKYEKIHMVMPGDTLWDIATAYGTSVEVIARLNNLSDTDSIYVFQKLAMPAI